MVRTPSCDKSGLRKGTWTPEEDRKLIAYVTRYGCWNWRQLPRFAGLARCGKSCRLRWMNYLRPNLKRGNYTKEEEETIVRLHEELGNRWSAIAAQLPGRTDNEIKNHWHTTLKKRFNHKSSTGTKDAKNNSSDHPIKRVTSKEKEFETNLKNLLINPPSPPLILESSLSASLLSPQQPASSDQSQNSSITTDNTAVSSSVSYNNNNNNHNSDIDMALFEAYEANSGSFWTEPFFSDDLFMSSDISVPMMDLTNFEAQFPVLDGDEEILCPSGFYDEFEGLLNF
ncbi:hypothetical protein CCACVL1_06798 [Corchorus capsularis]|uniref:Uncharacterized protein n=1 Tax=Corchorus capsularis TaxID=210143 RepID=A0A1R3JCN6_COCAP|nr:hypothetical protein CCACVL1_06798 [Corchorus capsularis]